MLTAQLPAARGLGAVAALLVVTIVASCGPAPITVPGESVINGVPEHTIVPGYGQVTDGDYVLPPVPPSYLDGVNRRAHVAWGGSEGPGTIVIDPFAKFLYFVEPGGMAMRYPIAVGREGRTLAGTVTINRKVEWPGWTPTANMLAREPEIYGPFRGGVPGGLTSPLGARALYLYRGGRDTYYRIHGTNDFSSIGNSGSAGCIRLFNQDIIDLYDRVPNSTRVVIRTYAQSVELEGVSLANRGRELPPVYVPPEELLQSNDQGLADAPYQVDAATNG